MGRKIQIVAEEHIPDGDQDQIADLEQIDEDEEIDAILKRLMPVLPSFSGKNFDIWKMKMKDLLGSVDLWEFVQNGYEDPTEKRKDKITLYLVSSALNNEILSDVLYEFGEIEKEKMFWDIIEMKYSDEHKTNASVYEETTTDVICSNLMNSTTHIVDELEYAKADEDNCKTTHENENIVEEDLFEGETYEVSFDEDNSSHEEWSKLMHEKHLIDKLLFGEKSDPLAYTNQVEYNFIVAEKAEKEDEEKALLEEKNEKSKNCIAILMNVFECAGFATEECDVEHLGEVPDKFDEEAYYITDTKIESMDIEDEDYEVEEFFMKWSPEEIKFYYELMLQESVE